MEQIVSKRSWNDTGEATTTNTSAMPTASVTSDAKTTNVSLSLPSMNTQAQGYFTGTLGLLGTIGGLYFAFKKQSPWYLYIGYALLFGFIGGLAGQVGDRTIKAIRA